MALLDKEQAEELAGRMSELALRSYPKAAFEVFPWPRPIRRCVDPYSPGAADRYTIQARQQLTQPWRRQDFLRQVRRWHKSPWAICLAMCSHCGTELSHSFFPDELNALRAAVALDLQGKRVDYYGCHDCWRELNEETDW